MTCPTDFIHEFRVALHQAGVRFAITSGQACVYYGIQQTTKDSDWIIDPDGLDKLRNMLAKAERTGRLGISYRPICGAPLERRFLANGWTSHLAVTDADSTEHHIDLFGKAPRVLQLERDALEPDFASRQTVAQMKKTDREKDWPIVFSLGRQAVTLGDVRGVLHGQDADWLLETWKDVPGHARDDLCRQRPLLRWIDTQASSLRRAVAIERQIWMSVNRYRYGVFQRPWKDFFRQWRREPGFAWPPDLPFEQQHNLLEDAAQRFQLPPAPLDQAARQAAMATAIADAIAIFSATDAELDHIVPPLEVLLP
jgi:hypothetical protein